MAVAGQRVGLAGLREEDVSRPRPGRCKGAVLSPRGSASSFPAAPHGVSPPSQRSIEILHGDVSSRSLHETSRNLLQKLYMLDCVYSPFTKITYTLTFPMLLWNSFLELSEILSPRI
ncbi:uncharacterized protein LOC132514313 isoform X4 [Lagenorhynchus albirostris]|uniref:uncharacterized protein LOC132514302 isoform X3 n=1 Tax=Lagenorhynchus albirostris TaxID=27610 RepID=UPI0028E2C752|nr:uncharacterized protein LOC132514302 isoform X3 [Lagenorhynchus albirostris]XP_059994913.1 uncharacterized protein LOC132514313 isoform X4 [Lagenorhynchus albirostris]